MMILDALTLAQWRVVAFFVPVIIALLLYRIKRRDETQDKVHECYEIVPSELSRVAPTLDIKEDFFFGRHKLPRWNYISMDLPIERDLASSVRERILTIDKQRMPSYIEIIGERKQGKTTLLASIALSLARNKNSVVLWWKGIGDISTHDELLKRFYELEVNPFYRLFPKRKLIVIFDDIWTWRVSYGSEGQKYTRVLDKLAKSGILVLTSSSEELLPHPLGSLGHLSLSTSEAKSILQKLVDHEPAIFPRGIEARIPALLGNQRMYHGDLAAFMSNILKEAGSDHLQCGRELLEVFGGLDDENRRLAAWIAVGQLVDYSIPESLVKKCYPAYAQDSIETLFRGWVRREAQSRGSYELSMGAPYLGAWILQEIYSVNSMNDIYSLYSEIFTAVCKEKANTQRAEAELVRHILYRLSRGRHFRIPGVDTIALSRLLSDRFRNPLEIIAKGQPSLPTCVRH